MKKINVFLRILVLALVLLGAFSLMTVSLFAEEDEKYPIVDEADFLTKEQEDELYARIKSINAKYGISVMIYFTRDKYSESLDEYILLDRMYTDSSKIQREMRTDEDAILYFMSLDGGYRDYFFCRTGECLDALSDGREVDFLKEHAEEYMTQNDFYGAACEFLSITDLAMQKHREGESIVTNLDVLLDTLPIVIFISLLAGLIAVLIMKAGMRTVRAKENAHMYAKRDSFEVRQAADIFLFRTVSRAPRPQNNSSSSRGGGGGGRGGGGRC